MKIKKRKFEPKKSNLVEIPTHVKNMGHYENSVRKTKSQLKQEKVDYLIEGLKLSQEEKDFFTKKTYNEKEDDWLDRVLSYQSMPLTKISDLYKYFFLGVEKLGKKKREHIRNKVVNDYEFKDGEYCKKNLLGKILSFK